MIDQTAPTLKHFDLPSTIDVSTGQGTVTVSVEAEDGEGGSGIDSVTVFFDNNVTFTFGAGNNFTLPDLFGTDTFKDSTPTTSSGQLTLTDATNPGTYHITQVWVKDMAGNQATYTTQQLAALGINTGFQVAGGKVDNVSPTLLALDLPSTIDLSSGSTDVPVSVTATDNAGGSGVDSVTVFFDDNVTFTFGAGNNFSLPDLFGTDTFRDSTPTTSSGYLSLTDATNPGAYHIRQVWVKDMAGNQAIYTAQQLTALGINTSFQVTGSRVDKVAPTLVALDLPSTIDLAGSPKDVPVSVTATDNAGGSGVDSVTVFLDKNVSFTFGPGNNFTLPELFGTDTFKDSTPTTSSGQLTLTQATNPGTYHVTQAWVKDMAGNQATYTAQQLTALGIKTSFSIVDSSHVNHPHTGDVAISGNAMQNEKLTVMDTLADADGIGPVSYVWLRDGTSIDGATGKTYTLAEADVGKSISVRASYIDAYQTYESATSTAMGPVANVNDAPSGSVTISGQANPGGTLSAANTLADADGMGTVSYQWLRGGAPINGATSSTFTLSGADLSALITVRASYTDGHGTVESITSAGLTIGLPPNGVPAGQVSITGNATQNALLTAWNSVSDADGMGPVSYQWQRDGNAVAGATGVSYTLTEADVGTAVTVRASYTDGLGKAESVTSTATPVVANVNDAPTGSVTISGLAKQGVTLSAANTLADLDGMGAITCQWLRDDAAIAGATATTYTLSQADVGHVMRVVATYVDGHGARESVSSTGTAAVAAPPPPPPPLPPVAVNSPPSGAITLDGTHRQGETLTAKSTLQDAQGMGVLNWQWQRDGIDIAGATAATYKLTQGDVGMHVSVNAHYTDGAGNAESARSAASEVVANVNDAPTGYLVVAGANTEGASLTALSTLGDADGVGTLQYQWLRDGQAIAGATAPQYTLQHVDIGARINVQASYTDGFGAHESASSGVTGVVAALAPAMASPQLLAGTAGNDNLHGGSASDVFVGSQGDDKLDGGAGLDTVVYARPVTQFEITMTASGFTIADKSGGNATDQLVNIERAVFGDAAVALDIDGSAGMAFRLYQAVFDRAPDTGGMGYWLDALDKGMSLHTVAQSFMDSGEFTTMYGGQPDNQSFLTAVYKFALHREPDAAGLAWWNDALQTGSIGKVDVLIQFSESMENQTQVIGSEQHGIQYTPWH